MATQEVSNPTPITGREVLPIPNKAYAGPVYYDAKDPAAIYPPIQEVRPPQGAPNVLVVLIDDVGFAASSAFGGPINTPKDVELILSKTTADGFVGASSLERMGVEDSLTNLTREFKSVPWGRK